MLLENKKASELLSTLPSCEILRSALSKCTLGAAIKQHTNVSTVVCALKNSDLDQMLSCIYARNPDGVVLGISVLAKAVHAENAICYLPDDMDASKLEDAASAAGMNLEIRHGFVNVREHRHDLICHPSDFAALASILTDGESNTAIVAVKRNGNLGEPKEVPYGTTIASLVGSDCKAVRIGSHFVFPADFGKEITSQDSLGSGVIEILGEDTCMVQEAGKLIRANRAESCGKCTFCRECLYQLDAMFTDITEKRGKRTDIALAKEFCEAMQLASGCSLGADAALPVMDVLEQWSSEVESHITGKGCPAGKCTAFVTYYVDPMLCEGCTDCMDVCPKDCIEGKSGHISMIDEFDCIRCGKCMAACENGAIKTCAGRLPKLPTRLTRVGRFRK